MDWCNSLMNTTQPKLDAFTLAYLEAAFWTTSYDEDGNEFLEDKYEFEDIAPEALEKIIADCKKFQEDNKDLLTDENCLYKGCPMIEYAGHDFWLTRCGHGVGFFDGDWSEKAGQKLTEVANKFGNVDFYVGDDGRIYC